MSGRQLRRGAAIAALVGLFLPLLWLGLGSQPEARPRDRAPKGRATAPLEVAPPGGTVAEAASGSAARTASGSVTEVAARPETEEEAEARRQQEWEASAGRIEGRVLDPDGRPVSDVRVGVRIGCGDTAVMTGPDGRFALDGLPPAWHHLRVEPEDRSLASMGDVPVRVPVAGALAELEVRLERAARVRVVVDPAPPESPHVPDREDPDHPGLLSFEDVDFVPAVQVVATALHPGAATPGMPQAAGPPSGIGWIRNGVAELELAPGPWRLELSTDTLHGRVEVVLAPGENEVRLTTRPVACLRLTTRDSAGVAVPADLFLMNDEAEPWRDPILPDQEDDDAWPRFSHAAIRVGPGGKGSTPLPPGRWRALAVPHDSSLARVEASLELAPGQQGELALAFPRAREVRVTVPDALRDDEVDLWGVFAGPPGIDAREEAHGFVLGGLLPGDRALALLALPRVEGDDRSWYALARVDGAASEVTLVAAPASTLGLSLVGRGGRTVGRGWVVEARLLDGLGLSWSGDGRLRSRAAQAGEPPVAWTRPSWWEPPRGRVYAFGNGGQTDDLGRIELELLPLGRWQLEVPGLPPRTIELAPGAREELTLTVE